MDELVREYPRGVVLALPDGRLVGRDEYMAEMWREGRKPPGPVLRARDEAGLVRHMMALGVPVTAAMLRRAKNEDPELKGEEEGEGTGEVVARRRARGRVYVDPEVEHPLTRLRTPRREVIRDLLLGSREEGRFAVKPSQLIHDLRETWEIPVSGKQVWSVYYEILDADGGPESIYHAPPTRQARKLRPAPVSSGGGD